MLTTPRFQVLVYHKVSRDPHPFFAPVQPAIFERQMRLLSRRYRVMPLMELVERNRTGNVPSKAVAITFDDGYRDNYDFAFPILKKYRLPATIFITTGVIGNGQALWHDRVFDSFRYTTRESKPAIEPVLAKAKSLYGDARLQYVEEIERSLKPALDESASQRMLTWDQLREMHASGIDCGSHTVTHPVMSCLPRHEMIREVVESKREISEQIGCNVSSFAYPNGHTADYNDEVKAVLREAGYSCGLTCEWGPNAALCDPFEIKRGQPSHPQIQMFRLAFFLQRHGLN